MKNPTYGLLAAILRKVLKKPEVFGLQNAAGAKSSIFISNHEGFFGPVVLTLFANQNFVPWVVYENFDTRLCRTYIRNDFVEPTLHLSSPMSNVVAALISPICVGIMRYIDAIPVYHSSSNITETIDRSIDQLEQGKNLLIFPEDPKDESQPYIKSFQTGFVRLAKIFHEKNGWSVQFYPVYVDRNANQIRIGEKIIFDPKEPFHQERTRILKTLRERILAMRAESQGEKTHSNG